MPDGETRTVLVRGEGGVVQEHDVPLSEVMSDAVRKGRVVVVRDVDGTTPVTVADLDEDGGILQGARPDGRTNRPDTVPSDDEKADAAAAGTAARKSTPPRRK